MKKNITIGILAIALVYFIVLSYTKSNQAERYNGEAIANLELAEQHRRSAEEAQEMAVAEAANSRIAQRKVEELLADCQKK